MGEKFNVTLRAPAKIGGRMWPAGASVPVGLAESVHLSQDGIIDPLADEAQIMRGDVEAAVAVQAQKIADAAVAAAVDEALRDLRAELQDAHKRASDMEAQLAEANAALDALRQAAPTAEKSQAGKSQAGKK